MTGRHCHEHLQFGVSCVSQILTKGSDMVNGDRKSMSPSAFAWATLETEQRIESYLIECRATGDEEIIRDAEYLAELARKELTRQS